MKHFFLFVPPNFVTVLIDLFLIFFVGAFSRAEAGTFKGQYFSDPDLSWLTSYTSSTSTINFDWGNTGPQPNSSINGYMNATNYSASGNYHFKTVYDDGARLFLDGSSTPIINAWHVQSAR